MENIEFLENEKETLDNLILRINERENFDVNMHFNNRDFTILHMAAMDGFINIVKYLFENFSGNNLLYPHININSKDNKNTTPFMLACFYGRIDVVKYLYSKDENVLRGRDDDGWDVLQFAYVNDHVDVVKFLIEECGFIDYLNNQYKICGELNKKTWVYQKSYSILYNLCLNNSLKTLKYYLENIFEEDEIPEKILGGGCLTNEIKEILETFTPLPTLKGVCYDID